MAWEVIAEASSVEELQALTPAIDDIPNGSPILVTITLPWWLPLANLANLAGAEWFAERFSGAISVVDVRAPNAYNIEIEGTANGLLWVALIPILVKLLWGGLVLLGISTISKVVVAVQQTKQAEVAAESEQAKIDFVAKYEPIYGPQVIDWVKNIATVPEAVKAEEPSLMDELKKAIVPAVSIGTIVIIGALIFFGMQYLPKPRKAVAA